MINAEGSSYRLNGSDAIGFVIGEQFGVIAGAKVHPVGPSLKKANASGCMETRKSLERKGVIVNDKLVKDYVFDSPSQAGDVILGTTGGGPEKWINEDSRVSLSEERKMGMPTGITFK